MFLNFDDIEPIHESLLSTRSAESRKSHGSTAVSRRKVS